MENQHRKIKGYRELSQEEIDLMNEAKELEAKCLALHTKIVQHIAEQETAGGEARERCRLAEANRWSSIGKTNLQTAFMALVRSIAQPL